MARLAAVIFLAIGGAYAGIYYGVGRPSIEPSLPEGERPAHAFHDPGSPLEEVFVRVVYFVPRDKVADSPEGSWKEALVSSLEELSRFHELQFSGKSRLVIDAPVLLVTGEQGSVFYDTNDTNRGNPHALVEISAELQRKGILGVNDAEGADQSKKQITYIIYEGVGAAGMRDSALLSRKFLSDPSYEKYRSALLAHEFYHTIGAPDAYTEEDISFSEDLMGMGRERPLSENYLEKPLLASFGL